MTQETETLSPEQQEQQDTAAFSSGFSEVRGSPAAPAEPIEKTAEPPKTDDATPKGDLAEKPVEDKPAVVDPLAEFRNEMRTSLGRVDKVSDRLRNIEGTLGGLSQLTQELKAAVAAAKTASEASGAGAPTDAQLAFAASSPERWKQFQDDFPDFAEVMGGEFAALRAELTKAPPPMDTAALRADLAKDFQAQVAAAEARARVSAQIDFVHEGWEETVTTPEFEAWYGRQTPEVRSLSASPKPKDAIRMLDLFKADLKKAQERVEQDKRLENAITPQGVPHTDKPEDPNQAFAAGFREVRGS